MEPIPNDVTIITIIIKNLVFNAQAGVMRVISTSTLSHMLAMYLSVKQVMKESKDEVMKNVNLQLNVGMKWILLHHYG